LIFLLLASVRPREPTIPAVKKIPTQHDRSHEIRKIPDATFVVETSGEYDAPPASALREFLVGRGARRVTTIVHPLTAEGNSDHLVEAWEAAAGSRTSRRIRLPSRPPFTYPLDLLVPLPPPRADVHIGFNNLACARALLGRRAGRVQKVGYWAVDFVPDRFGQSSAMTRVYDAVDSWVCKNVDARFEVSEAARSGRDARHRLGTRPQAPSLVTPMGAWVDRVPHVGEDGFRARRVIWLGHMVERQGVGRLVEALGVLAARGVDFEAEFVGRGPEEQALRTAVERLGLAARVRFHGFVEDHADVDAILARGSVAVAPYDTTIPSFTSYADPGKLKSYLAAGLPIVTTDVPPNADEVAQRGGGEIVAFEPSAIAAAIERALADPEEWRRRRKAALALAHEYDWNVIFEKALDLLGYQS
jgi:glycosyltransferase involved in cell wall biosynthesis